MVLQRFPPALPQLPQLREAGGCRIGRIRQRLRKSLAPVPPQDRKHTQAFRQSRVAVVVPVSPADAQ
jgi:hypothetical protein